MFYFGGCGPEPPGLPVEQVKRCSVLFGVLACPAVPAELSDVESWSGPLPKGARPWLCFPFPTVTAAWPWQTVSMRRLPEPSRAGLADRAVTFSRFASRHLRPAKVLASSPGCPSPKPEVKLSSMRKVTVDRGSAGSSPIRIGRHLRLSDHSLSKEAAPAGTQCKQKGCVCVTNACWEAQRRLADSPMMSHEGLSRFQFRNQICQRCFQRITPVASVASVGAGCRIFGLPCFGLPGLQGFTGSRCLCCGLQWTRRSETSVWRESSGGQALQAPAMVRILGHAKNCTHTHKHGMHTRAAEKG